MDKELVARLEALKCEQVNGLLSQERNWAIDDCIQAIMGDASARKDEGTAAIESGLASSPITISEISDNHPLFQALLRESDSGGDVRGGVYKVWEMVKPYLRTTEPVSVSLGACMREVRDAMERSEGRAIVLTQIAFDAAGVAYGD